MIPKEKTTIAIIGLGYVGLPLALEFAKRFPVIGFDINERRIAELRAGRDSTREADASELSRRPTSNSPATPPRLPTPTSTSSPSRRPSTNTSARICAP